MAPLLSGISGGGAQYEAESKALKSDLVGANKYDTLVSSLGEGLSRQKWIGCYKLHKFGKKVFKLQLTKFSNVKFL